MPFDGCPCFAIGSRFSKLVNTAKAGTVDVRTINAGASLNDAAVDENLTLAINSAKYARPRAQRLCRANGRG